MTLTRHLLTSALLLGTVLLAPAAPAQGGGGRGKDAAGAVDLRPKFIKGQETRYTMALTNSTALDLQQMPEASGTQTMDQEIGLRFKVVEADPETGEATVELIYDSIKATMDTPMGEGTFDSAQPGAKDKENPVAPMLRQIVGTTLTLKMDRDGNITSVTGGEGLGGGGLGGASGVGGQLTGPDQVKSLFGPILNTRKGPGLAAVGEKWSNVDFVEAAPIGRFKMTTDHTLRSVRGGEATVEFTGKMELDSESATGAAPMRIKDSKYDGRYVWDTETGTLRQMDMEQTFTLDGAMQGIDMTMKGSTAMKLRRVDQKR